VLIEELVLHNFGIYKGRQSVNLAPIKKDAPIILIGGLNGGGKTTFLDALQLALYGKRARFSNRGNAAYDKYLAKSINSKVSPEEGAAVELQFRHHSDGKEKVYRIHRSWRVGSGGNTTERVEVTVNGSLDRVITDGWDEVVEEFLPVGISHLFFFDGEKIEAFANLENSRQLLEKAIHSLLGLDIVDRLNTDLSVFESKQKIKLKSDKERKQLEKLEAEIEAVEKNRLEYISQKAHQQTIIDSLEKKLRLLTETYKTEGGEIYESRERIEQEKQDLENRLEEVEEKLLDIAAGVAPLFLVRNLLSEIHAQSKTESLARQNAVLAGVLDERDESTLETLRNNDFNFETIAFLKSLLAEDRQERLESSKIESYLDLTENGSFQIQTLVQGNLFDETKAQLTEYLEQAENLRVKIDDGARKLKSVPDAERIALLQAEIDQLKTQIEQEKVKLAALELEAARLANEKEIKQALWRREVGETLEAGQENEDVRRILNHSDKVRGVIEKFRQKIIEKKVGQIQDLILDSYQKLLRKKSLVTNLLINVKDFSLELGGADDQVISPERLSAGERQLLAVSMLWGLARASGRPLPAIIDTPLGRLDSEHRLNLVEKYFPNASHQVFLLSTDEEIDQKLFDQMKDAISRTYTLDYDDKERATTIREGYFNLNEEAIWQQTQSDLAIQLAA
jgi:DNA sulfur modification protein DndD